MLTTSETILVVLMLLALAARWIKPHPTVIDGTVQQTAAERPAIAQKTPIPKPDIGQVEIHGNPNCIMDLKACNCLLPESPIHTPSESNVISILDAPSMRRARAVPVSA